jgi:putative nucleotidyltransferase with HDIG domain
MTRTEAWQILNEYTKNPNLIKHALAVEAAMRAYAEKFGEDVETWRVVGVLHDFDYEKYPTAADHPYRGAEILRDKGLDETLIRAIMSHAEYTGVPRDTKLAKTLFAVDELCGFITAVTLVRPDKKIATVTPQSVKKKFKAKAFAAQVSREDMTKGAEELGVDLTEHIGFVIAAMAEIADELGL